MSDHGVRTVRSGARQVTPRTCNQASSTTLDARPPRRRPFLLSFDASMEMSDRCDDGLSAPPARLPLAVLPAFFLRCLPDRCAPHRGDAGARTPDAPFFSSSPASSPPPPPPPLALALALVLPSPAAPMSSRRPWRRLVLGLMFPKSSILHKKWGDEGGGKRPVLTLFSPKLGQVAVHLHDLEDRMEHHGGRQFEGD